MPQGKEDYTNRVNPPWGNNYTTTGIDNNIWVDKGAMLADEYSKVIEKLQQQQAQQVVGNARYELNNIVDRLDKIEYTLETLLSMMKLILSTQIEKEFSEKEIEKRTSQEDVS